MGLINGDESPVAIFPSAVTPEACDLLLAELDHVTLEPGRVVEVGERVDREMRMTFLPRDHWAAQIALGAAEQANESMGWRYALTGVESLQLGVYRPGDHHDWHMDTLSHGELVRKLSLVVQLDEPTAYTGGDLELLRFGVEHAEPLELPQDVLRQRGTVIVFPSFLQHRVAPVLTGCRRTLVAWMMGPRFR
jgi:PKHD-type hydroxylase